MTQTYYLPGRSGEIATEDLGVIGHIGEIAPRVLVNWGLKTPVSVAEISLTPLITRE